MKHVAIALSAIVALTGVAAAQDAGPLPKKAVDPNKRVCKTMRPTGSRVGETVCHTNAEWQAISQDQTGKAAQLMQDNERR